MSQSFRLKYDQMREGNPTHEQSPPAHPAKAFENYYTEESHARNICFVWLDGKRIFLSYSYLVSGEYLPADNTITLSFTTHVFILKGVNLESLFYDIMNQLSRQVVCMDERYNLIGEDERFVVNEIEIQKMS